jgi:hypothetical protein
MVLSARAPKVGGASATQLDDLRRPAPGVGKRTRVQDAEATAQPSAPRTAAPRPAPSGQPLPGDFRARMERAFGADFSQVRVREDPEVPAMGALAYTRGTDIHVAPGHYDPTGAQGQELLGHELAHVVQQTQGRAPATAQAMGAAVNTDPGLEREADEHASRAVRGEPAGTAAPGAASAPPVAAPPAAAAIQYKLNRHPQVQDQDNEIESGELVAVGAQLQDTGTGRLYRYVSGYPDGKAIVLSGVTVQGMFVYSFDDDTVRDYHMARHEGSLGRDINRQMLRVNEGLGAHPARGVHYEHTYREQFPDAWQDQYVGGHADPATFERLAPMTWRLRPGRSATAAIHAWLHGLTIAECGSTLVAIQLRELLQLVGEDKFDQMFGSTDLQVVPSVQRLVITGDLGQCIPHTMIKGAGVNQQGHAEFKLGAKYFFQNHPAYLRKHPDGALQGENAVYMGHQDGQHHFAGLGIGPVTMRRMCEILAIAYNDPRTEDDYRFIVMNASKISAQALQHERESGRSFRQIYEASPDLMHPHYRIGGEVPDQTTLMQWLASGAGIQGQGVMLDTQAILQRLLDGM